LKITITEDCIEVTGANRAAIAEFKRLAKRLGKPVKFL